ncbi:cytochrome P450 [Streptomyces sp. ME19-01-6]|uniref:cytochrome P450 n=1 Tax=Streptomyces sp. ME19-01-6 TaxID=3028686 RepID=UPI0029B621A8|nr:cytochrome P450 [Streptomyces sp. ME19-01-6]MDX3224825.1 cytochrome P450 [Streptomyces sp. ME19-01-6]
MPTSTPDAGPTPPPGCPAHSGPYSEPGQPEPLYGPEFATDPSAVYARLRAYGPVAPVELSPGVHASLVTSYATALEIMRNTETFPRDPRRWEALADGTVPMDNPVVPMMAYRPNAMYTDGEVHERFRSAVSDTLNRLNPHALRTYVEQSADLLIDLFGPEGEAELLTEYCARLPLLVFNQLFGCPPELSEKLVKAMAAIFDADEDTEQANALLSETLFALVAMKRADPQADITSWLLAHPARLDDEEMVHQIALLTGGGTEPVQNLICNALRLLLSDDRFAGDLSGGTMPVDEALDEVLWTDPPIANYATHFPARDVTVAGHRLLKGTPVLISMAAANNDPHLVSDRRGNRAHLAFGAGPHACPAKDPARIIASTAIEKLLDRLPDIELATEPDQLRWRHGPFHRSLAALPVRFPPVAAKYDDADAVVTDQNPGGNTWNPSPSPSSSTPTDTTSTGREHASGSAARRPWWNSLTAWWRGR